MTAAGGQGANQAVAAARAGGKVSFIACHGRDRLADEALGGFVRDRVDVRHIVRDPVVASGAALILVAKGGENSIAVAGGANERLSAANVRKARAAIAQATILLKQLETPLETIEVAARIAAANGTRVILNPAPARPLPDRLLRRVSILTPHESEAESLAAIKIKGRAARKEPRLRFVAEA